MEEVDLCAQHLEVVRELAVVDLKRAQRDALWPRRAVAEHIAMCRAFSSTSCFSFNPLASHNGCGLVWNGTHHVQNILKCIRRNNSGSERREDEDEGGTNVDATVRHLQVMAQLVDCCLRVCEMQHMKTESC